MNPAPQLLVLARHAESTCNHAKPGQVFFRDDDARGELAGQPDHLTPLTEQGWTQARELGIRLRSEFGSFDCIFHSGYKRAAHTATAILEAFPTELRSSLIVRGHLFLRERDPGYAFNFTADEAKAAFPWLQAYWNLAGPFFARPPGGESLADVAMRVHLFLESVKQEVAGKSVLIVTHSGALRMLRFWLEGWTHQDVLERWETEAISNCGFVVYRANEEQRLAKIETPDRLTADRVT